MADVQNQTILRDPQLLFVSPEELGEMWTEC